MRLLRNNKGEIATGIVIAYAVMLGIALFISGIGCLSGGGSSPSGPGQTTTIQTPQTPGMPQEQKRMLENKARDEFLQNQRYQQQQMRQW